MIEVRYEILQFAKALEEQMRYNESRGKTDEWKEADPEFLFKRLVEEVEELSREVYQFKPIQKNIQHESKDVGSLAFFIWYNSCLRECQLWKIAGMGYCDSCKDKSGCPK